MDRYCSVGPNQPKPVLKPAQSSAKIIQHRPLKKTSTIANQQNRALKHANKLVPSIKKNPIKNPFSDWGKTSKKNQSSPVNLERQRLPSSLFLLTAESLLLFVVAAAVDFFRHSHSLNEFCPQSCWDSRMNSVRGRRVAGVSGRGGEAERGREKKRKTKHRARNDRRPRAVHFPWLSIAAHYHRESACNNAQTL